jgi:competence protein ComEA
MINRKMYRLDVSLSGLIFLLFGLCLGTSLANTLIDANTASEDQLQSIAGIGPATAQKIIQARQKKPFKDLRDFSERVPGVGPKRLQQYSDAGLVVKRAPAINPAPSQPSKSKLDGNVKTQDAEESVVPPISVIEGGLRESNGRTALKSPLK